MLATKYIELARYIIRFHTLLYSTLFSHFFFPEHSPSMDIDLANKKYLSRSEEIWDSLHSSGWWTLDESDTGNGKQKQTANGEK